MITFPEWRPDAGDLGTQVAITATNVIPGANKWSPFQSLSEISAALGAACVGAIYVQTTSGSNVLFAGTAVGLYKYASATSWTTVTRLVGGAYAVTSGEYWEWAQFGDSLIAVNITDVPQVIAITAGANFAALGGSPPQARHVAVIGDYVVLSGLNGDLKTIQWSGTNASTSWTPGTGNSDLQTFPDGGDVGRVNGLDNGLVFQKGGVRQMIANASSLVFTFARVAGLRGSASPFGVVTVGGVSFYYGYDGFYATSGVESVNIGADAVNDWFADDASPSKLYTMLAIADPKGPRVYWAYRSNDAGSPPFDKMIGYDWARKKWFLVAIPTGFEYVLGAVTFGLTLEDLDALYATLEAVPFSLDSPIWAGGTPNFAAFSQNHKLGFFTGSNMEATVESAEMQLNPPDRSLVTGVVPAIDGTANVAVSVAGRDRRQNTTSYGTEGTLLYTGEVPLLEDWNYHRFKFRVPAGETWTALQGFDVNSQPSGSA